MLDAQVLDKVEGSRPTGDDDDLLVTGIGNRSEDVLERRQLACGCQQKEVETCSPLIVASTVLVRDGITERADCTKSRASSSA